MAGLTCSLELPDAGPGRHGLRFAIRNDGPAPVTVGRWEPFVDFDLTVSGPEGQLRIVRPALDIGAQPVSEPLPPGGTLWLETPIQLAFDPGAPPSGGPDRFVWTILSPPRPVHLAALLHLADGDVPCAADLDPGGRDRP